MSTMTVASFAQNGRGFTQIARNLVLDGKWRDGLQFLVEGFEGMTYDIAFQILKGTHVIDEQFNLVEELDSEYQEDVRDIYCHNKFYELNNLYEFEDLIDNVIVDQDISDRNFTYNIPAFDVYVDRYIKGADQVAFDVTEVKNQNRSILATKVDSNTIPMWLDKNDFARSAKIFAKEKYPEKTDKSFSVVKPFNSSFQEVSIVSTPSVKEQQSALVENHSDLKLDLQDKMNIQRAINIAEEAGFDNVQSYSDFHRKKVLEAINKRGCEWKTLHIDVGGMNEQISYPYELAAAYALSRTSLKAIASWEPVSERELKMASDSPLHTDLWLALGFNLDGLEYKLFTREHNIFTVLVDEVQRHSFPASEFTTLNSAGLESFEGNVVFHTNKNITKKDILVIPHAGLEFELQAMKTGLVIAEFGGKLAHLVVVGRELGLPLIRVDNALTKFSEGMSLQINFNDNTIIAKLK